MEIGKQLGVKYNQQGVYVATFGENAKGWEYGIQFKDAETAFEAAKTLSDYGIEGGASDITDKMLYIGDSDGSLSSNVQKFYEANKANTSGKIEANKADIQFLEEGTDYFSRKSPGLQSGQAQGSGNTNGGSLEFMPRGAGGDGKVEEPPKIGQRQMATKYLNLTPEQDDTIKNIRSGVQSRKAYRDVRLHHPGPRQNV